MLQPFSLVIPTYKEANNIELLVQTIAGTDFGGRTFEVLLMDDDSRDGSIEIVLRLQKDYPWLHIVERYSKKGLSHAVVDGCHRAAYPLIVSMDADLSHPATSIASMLALLESNEADLVIGSRYVPGGSVDSRRSWQRRMISRLSAFVTKSFLHLSAHDPLSGFFAIKKSTFLRGNITDLTGWKIALEILIRCNCRRVVEVPIHFADRQHSKSKLTPSISLAFLRQLGHLAYFQFLK